MARTVKCPSCGAELTVKDNNRDFMFCEFCGTKVRLDDYQETHRYVNEAEIEKIRAAKELELKRMEKEEKDQKEAEEWFKRNWKWIILGLVAFVAFCMLMEYITPEKESAVDRSLDILEYYVKSKV